MSDFPTPNKDENNLPSAQGEPRRHLTSAERQAIYAERAKKHRHTAKKSAKEKKILLGLIAAIAVFVLVVGLVAGLIVNKTVLEPRRQYERAEALFAEGSYLKAYQAFSDLGSFRDSKERAAASLLKNAQVLSGRENVIMGYSSTQPWFSFDAEGGLRFDKDKYKGGTELVIPDVFDDVLVTRIAAKGFFYADTFTKIEIPASVTFIGERAFFACSALEEIVLSDNVTVIGESAFANCTAAKTLTIGKGLTEIGQRAFKDCASLTEVVIPEGVTVIASRAFNGCAELKKLSLPSTLTSIGGFAFTDCKKLESVTFAGTRAALEAAAKADDGEIITGCKGLVCAG